jgi:hypothetical protein
MQIHVSAAAVIGGQMEYGVHTLHCRAGNAGFAQIGMQKIDFTAAEMLPDIPQMSAGQIINDAYFRAPRQKLVGQR